MEKYIVNKIDSPNIGIALNKRINKKKIGKNILLYIPRKKINLYAFISRFRKPRAKFRQQQT